MSATTVSLPIKIGVEPKIEGLPAGDFIMRRVKAIRGDGAPHPVPILCVGYKNGLIALKRDKLGGGINSIEYAQPSSIKAWWSRNPDLKDKARALGVLPYEGGSPMAAAFAEVEVQEEIPEVDLYTVHEPEPEHEPEIEEPEEIVPPPPAPMPQPEPPKETPKETTNSVSVKGRKISGFQLGIDADMSWMQDFKALQDSVKEREEIEAAMDDLRNRLLDSDLMVEMAVEALEDKGVKILWEKSDAADAAVTSGRTPIKGRLFIAHETDSPDVETLCVRNEFGRYCYIDPKNEYFKLRWFDNDLGHETRIEEFGISVELMKDKTEHGEGVLVGTKCGVSKAKYLDGGVRRWLGGSKFMLHVPEQLMQFIEKQ